MTAVRDNLPMALKGDYDGNGTSDIILLGIENEVPVALAFMFDVKGRVKSFVAHKFEKEDKNQPMDFYLVNIPKTKINHKIGKSRDAFQVENFGGIAVPVLFNGKNFVRNNPKNGFLFNEQDPKKQ